jgi:PAS domain S-box-containing protein
MPWPTISESTRALAQPITYLGAAALAAIFCLSAYLLVALVPHLEAELSGATHQHVHLYWGIALALSAAVLIVIGHGIWRERKLVNAKTRMRQTEDAMAQSHERYHLLESALNGGIWDRNLLTDDCYLSPRWKEILDFDDNDLPNSAATFFDLLHPDDKALMIEAFRAHVEDGKSYNLATRLRCKNGDYRWVNSRAKVIRDDGNRPIRMLGVMVDVTERKKAEAEMAESRDNLARAEQMARLGHFKCAHGSSERTWSDGPVPHLRKIS